MDIASPSRGKPCLRPETVPEGSRARGPNSCIDLRTGLPGRPVHKVRGRKPRQAWRQRQRDPGPATDRGRRAGTVPRSCRSPRWEPTCLVPTMPVHCAVWRPKPVPAAMCEVGGMKHVGERTAATQLCSLRSTFRLFARNLVASVTDRRLTASVCAGTFGNFGRLEPCKGA